MIPPMRTLKPSFAKLFCFRRGRVEVVNFAELDPAGTCVRGWLSEEPKADDSAILRSISVARLLCSAFSPAVIANADTSEGL